MSFIWDYKTKKKLYQIVEKKLFELDKNLPNAWLLKNPCLRGIHPDEAEKYYKKAAKYLDDLGCIRIVKVRISGWELEDSDEAKNPKFPWKSVNDKRYIHIKNPLSSLKGESNMEYLIRIPREIAEKFIILGMP